jgi:hypothetical protein
MGGKSSVSIAQAVAQELNNNATQGCSNTVQSNQVMNCSEIATAGCEDFNGLCENNGSAVYTCNQDAMQQAISTVVQDASGNATTKGIAIASKAGVSEQGNISTNLYNYLNQTCNPSNDITQTMKTKILCAAAKDVTLAGINNFSVENMCQLALLQSLAAEAHESDVGSAHNSGLSLGGIFGIVIGVIVIIIIFVVVMKVRASSAAAPEVVVNMPQSKSSTAPVPVSTTAAAAATTNTSQAAAAAGGISRTGGIHTRLLTFW